MGIIRCENVYKSYSVGEVQIRALRGITLTINEGEIVSIVGPSGSGKTTLLNIIGGLDNPDSGTVIVDGEEISRLSEKKLIEFRRGRIGFIFQHFNLIPVLTAYENVEIPLAILGVPKQERKRRVMELLKLVGLEHRANHKPYELSGGEQQRVAIARALAYRPKIVLADEPTGELDSENTRVVVDILKKLAKEEGVTVVIATHDVEEVAKRTDRIIRILDGKVVGEERPQ